MRGPTTHPAVSEPLGLLLLPVQLEQFELAEHARRLLAIPRVVALEPPRHRVPRLLRDVIPTRQVRRLRLPGEPRLVVLYHPAQYPLARGICARFQGTELWYLRTSGAPGAGAAGREPDELTELDQLAQERALETRLISTPADLPEIEETLRLRFRELEVISHRPFVPGARVERR